MIRTTVSADRHGSQLCRDQGPLGCVEVPSAKVRIDGEIPRFFQRALEVLAMRLNASRKARAIAIASVENPVLEDDDFLKLATRANAGDQFVELSALQKRKAVRQG